MTIFGVSLYSGVGAIDLGLSIALSDYRCIAFVESNSAKVEVLRARMADGWLGEADLEFDVDSYHPPGVDLVSAGYPCLWASTAARGANVAESQWRQVVRVARESRASVVFVENVKRQKGLVDGLESLGYETEVGFFAASAVGAPHIRRRVFTLGIHADGNGESAIRINDEVAGLSQPEEAHRGPWDDPRGDLRVANGLTYGMDSARFAGDAAVPLVVAHAFRALSNRIGVFA